MIDADDLCRGSVGLYPCLVTGHWSPASAVQIAG